MTNDLAGLGWSAFFARQHDADATGLPMRAAQIHRDRIEALGVDGAHTLTTGPYAAGDIAVGDWVIAEAGAVTRLLERQTVLQRRAAGEDARPQLIAANVDTLFITTSCNADFNPARLERYLALAHEAGCFPVLVLTKADLADDPADWAARAQRLDRAAPVLVLDATDPAAPAKLAQWCGLGQTGAVVGSSGVGKSTLAAGLTGRALETAAIREDDARGRHTTTTRNLMPMTHGGWLIDTPGMRALRLTDAAAGIDAVFDDIAALAAQCRFSDCGHRTEPGCAVLAAIEDGTLDPDRLARWDKLRREEAHNSATLAESRARNKAFGKMVRGIVKEKRRQ